MRQKPYIRACNTWLAACLLLAQKLPRHGSQRTTRRAARVRRETQTTWHHNTALPSTRSRFACRIRQADGKPRRNRSTLKLATTGAFANPWVCCSVRMAAASNCLMHAHCITLKSQTFNWRGDMKFGTVERSDGLLPYVSQLQWRVFRFSKDPEQICGTPQPHLAIPSTPAIHQLLETNMTTTSYALVVVILFCWTSWVTVAKAARPKDRKGHVLSNDFFLSSSLLPPRTPRATQQPSIHNNSAHPTTHKPVSQHQTQQHNSDHGSQPVPQVARALQLVHLPRRIHFEEPIQAEGARRPLGTVSSMLLSPLDAPGALSLSNTRLTCAQIPRLVRLAPEERQDRTEGNGDTN